MKLSISLCVYLCVSVIMKEYNEDYSEQEWMSYSAPVCENGIGLHLVDIVNIAISKYIRILS